MVHGFGLHEAEYRPERASYRFVDLARYLTQGLAPHFEVFPDLKRHRP
jgi:hypothetical protein